MYLMSDYDRIGDPESPLEIRNSDMETQRNTAISGTDGGTSA